MLTVSADQFTPAEIDILINIGYALSAFKLRHSYDDTGRELQRYLDREVRCSQFLFQVRVRV